MDPLTIIALAGTAMSAIGKVAGGFMDSESSKLQANVAASNTAILMKRAELEKRGAELTDAKGALEEGRLREHLARVLGGDTAHFTASNLDPTAGSPALLQGFNAAQAEVDAGLIHARMRAGEAEAYGRAASTMTQATQSGYQEASARMRSNQSIIAGLFGAGTAVLQGVGRMRWGGLPGDGGGITQANPSGSWAPEDL